MKGQQFNITNNLMDKANGIFECYNVTENMIHLARVGKDGKKLSPNAKNLMNIKADNFAEGIKAGMIVAA